MPTNFYMFFIAALIPMLVGAIYYNPKVFGTAWMNSNGFTEEDLKGSNMIKIFGFSYLFSVMMALILAGVTIHQTQLMSMLAPAVMESGSETQQLFNQLMADYGTNYRSFGHGALHGGVIAVFIAWPIIGINALFERRGWKYVGIHVGYWFICLALMGGILCQTLKYAPLS